MAQYEQLVIQRKPEVLKAYGLPRSTFYARIKEGLIPPPIFLGGTRAVGWPLHETNTMIAAMIAGKAREELKEIVVSIIKKQQSLRSLRFLATTNDGLL